MGIFDSILNLMGGVSDSAVGSIGDALGGIPEVPALQELQEQVSTFTDGATESITSVTEQAQTSIEDITQNF